MKVTSLVGKSPTLFSEVIDLTRYAASFITAADAASGMVLLKHPSAKTKFLDMLANNQDYKTFSHGVLIGMQHRLMRTISTMEQVYANGVANVTQDYTNTLEMLLVSMASSIPNSTHTVHYDATKGFQFQFNKNNGYPKAVISQLATIDNRHVALELNLILKAQVDLRNLYDYFLETSARLATLLGPNTVYMRADIAEGFKQILHATDADVREALFPDMSYVLTQCMTSN